MSDPIPAMRAFAIGDVLSTSFGVLLRNLGGFLVLTVLIVGATVLVELALGFDLVGESAAGEGIVSDILDSLATSMITAMVAYGTFRDLRGDRARLSEIVSRGLRLIVPIFFVGVLVSLAIGAGFVLLIVPGLILWTILWVAMPAAVVERCGVFEAFNRSGALTKGFRWKIFGLALVIYVPISVVIALMFFGATLASSDLAIGVAVIAAIVIGALMSLFSGVASAVSYFQLRAIKEGIGIEDLAAVFD